METIVKKVCKKHGYTDFVKRKDGYLRCKKCSVDAVKKRREKLKKLAIEYKGGCCQICGYNRCTSALEFHHIEKEQKEYGISAGGYTRSFKKIKLELDKCILVCSNCHREIHDGLVNLSDVSINDEK